MGRWSDLEAGLREADAIWAREGMPAHADHAVRRRLREARRTASGSRRGFVLATGLTLVAAGAAILAWRASHPAAPDRLGGFEVAAGAPDLRTSVDQAGTVEVAAGTVTLSDPASGTTLDVAAGARVRREPMGGVRVVNGSVLVRVARRAPSAPPARVWVSHGQIVVMGTRFRVTQRADGGEVFLEEGHVRFLRDDGQAVVLEPGQSVSWPETPDEQAVEPAAPVAEREGDETPDPTSSAASKTRPAEPPPLSADDLPEFLEEIAVLRSRGRYRDASEELARRLRTADGRATRERLSFELGSILSYQLKEPAAACKHWLRHRREFGRGRYRAEVRQAQEHLRCRGARANP